MEMNDTEAGKPTSDPESQDQAPQGLEQIGRPVWAAIVAAALVLACLGGIVLGSVLVSAGVSAYSGWAGVSVTKIVVTVAFISGPTYTPYPTYTPLSTYTPQPTLTLAPPAPAPTELPPVIVVTATAAPPPTLAPPAEDLVYTVQEGDTPQSIADQFGVDIVLVIYANDLQGANDALEVGSQITLPTRAADLCVPPNEPLQSAVAGVVDGDTINVQLEEMLSSVNYVGVVAPALAPVPEPFGVEALNANRELVGGQNVTLIVDTTESETSGQLPRYVLVGDVFVNYEQVRQGFAQAVSNEVDTACDDLFILAEQQARLDGLGMWLLQTPGAATPAAPATTAPPAGPPATLTPTSTSSLGFSCNCKPNFVWGNFTNQAQADVCRGICEIAAARRQALCATAYASGSSLGAAVCK